MNSKTTVLRESRHGEFLNAQRQDPVTHQVFAAGDRVTRCARCLVPFLDSSWEAIGRTHCGQSATVALDNFETPPPPPEESEPAATVPAPAAAHSKPTRLKLAPIPDPLREVPIKLN